MKALALVLAGGEGNRLGVLTDNRAKPAMPFAGVYRLIDFPMSNCLHSGLADVWIAQQYQPHSLNDHISNGRPWDLDKTYGGLRLLPPHQGGKEGGWHQGNADAIFRNRSFIAAADPDVLIVLSADHVYKLDYSSVVSHHLERGAAATLVTTKVPLEEASNFGTVEADGDGNVTDFEYKPDSPRFDLVTTEVFVFSTEKLLADLEDLAGEDEDEPLEDFGDELLSRMVSDGAVVEYRLDGYWRDLGQISSYWSAHMDLFSERPPLDLDDPDWPVLTLGAQRPPAHVHEKARNANSLLSPGCVVRGEIRCSVIGPGVVVEEGAVVNHSVVLDEVRISAGATVDHAIIDAGARIGERASVGTSSRASKVGDEDIAVVGGDCDVEAGATVGAGEQLPGSE
ncbi:MAG: glucose-1-phosphate adenylyltransferase [Actinobacteria bacterium]|nr:glucose-1-phosphate adenylyltransferase [Actinomycetota bacterium]